MKAFLLFLIGLFLAAAAGSAIAAGTGTSTMMTADSVHWVAATGAAKGSWNATLSGDPTKPGTSVIRVKMPNGYRNLPHYHAHPEFITVISGSLLFGTGDTIDTSKAKTLPAGSFITIPAGEHHWSIAQGTTIEQVSGEGPLNNIPVKHGAM
jgi:quercetin dioxygenase-like cupin family protein